jgi:ketosteroid isomerase-like protein
MGEVVVTRVQRSGPPRRTRNLEERLAIRFPGVFRRLAAVAFRLLSPRSRLRREVLRRVHISAYASFDRRDWELNLLLFAPESVLEFPSGMQTLGLAGKFRGHEGRIEALEQTIEVWGTSEFEPAYILDLRDRVVALGIWHNRASASGVSLEQEFAQVATLRNGLITRDQGFFSWEEALRAAGVEHEPQVQALLTTRRSGTSPARG